MTEQEMVYNAMPGTVAEIMRRTGLTEYRVRAEIINLRHRDVRIEGVGPLNASRVYHARGPLPDQNAPMPKNATKPRKPRKKAKPRKVARPSVGKTARQRPRQLFRLPDAPQATLAQERAVSAEPITRDCLRCKTTFETTRHGPRYCGDCRARMSKLN